MRKSIRWRLQLWYALILLLVVAGFASTLYYQIGRARLDEIDADLHAAARALEGSLRVLPPHVLDPKHPPKKGPKKGPRFPPADHLLRELRLPPQLRQHEDGGPDLYFAIWRDDGRLIRSTPMPTTPPVPEWIPPPGAPPFLRQRDSLRELILAGPRGTIVLVGRDIARERKPRAALGWTLLLTGSAVWAVGLAGGWLLSSRLLRPIETITATAATISAGSLSQRFDIAEVDSELGRLAAVLNATFARLRGRSRNKRGSPPTPRTNCGPRSRSSSRRSN
jgi:two-component system, OmpR family, sensor kinase